MRVAALVIHLMRVNSSFLQQLPYTPPCLASELLQGQGRESTASLSIDTGRTSTLPFLSFCLFLLSYICMAAEPSHMTQLSLIHGCRIGLLHRYLLVRPSSGFFSVFLVGDKKGRVWNIYKPIHSGRVGFSPCYTHSYIKNAHIQSGKMDWRKIQDIDYISSFTYKEFKDKLLKYLILFASTWYYIRKWFGYIAHSYPSGEGGHLFLTLGDYYLSPRQLVDWGLGGR